MRCTLSRVETSVCVCVASLETVHPGPAKNTIQQNKAMSAIIESAPAAVSSADNSGASSEIVLIHDNPQSLVLFTDEIRRLVANGKKIPTSLWKQDPKLCQSIRDKHNQVGIATVREAIGDGFAFVKSVESKTGRALSIRLRRISDGGKRAEKDREVMRKDQLIEAAMQRIAALEKQLNGAKDNAANLTATNV